MCSNINYFCSYKFYHRVLYILWDSPVKNRKDGYRSTEKILVFTKLFLISGKKKVKNEIMNKHKRQRKIKYEFLNKTVVYICSTILYFFVLVSNARDTYCAVLFFYHVETWKWRARVPWQSIICRCHCTCL